MIKAPFNVATFTVHFPNHTRGSRGSSMNSTEGCDSDLKIRPSRPRNSKKICFKQARSRQAGLQEHAAATAASTHRRSVLVQIGANLSLNTAMNRSLVYPLHDIRPSIVYGHICLCNDRCWYQCTRARR
jgi:hypothetical protein